MEYLQSAARYNTERFDYLDLWWLRRERYYDIKPTQMETYWFGIKPDPTVMLCYEQRICVLIVILPRQQVLEPIEIIFVLMYLYCCLSLQHAANNMKIFVCKFPSVLPYHRKWLNQIMKVINTEVNKLSHINLQAMCS